ncbi:MAG: calcium/sodium antiporter [Gammaproteobacteria bacterium]
METVSVAAVLAGFALLIWGAHLFVVGAAATAHDLGVSHLLIGVTIVGLGTSAPELLVSANAALRGVPDIAIGNALGSNIANVGLILGLTALIVPLTVQSQTLRREMPVLLAITLLTLLPFLDGYFSRMEGLALIAGLMLMLVWLIRAEVSNNPEPDTAAFDDEIPSDMSLPKALAMTLAGLLILLGSSNMLVWGAQNIALALGVSELVIGLTVIAIGTSLPELAASLTAAMKNQHDIAIGNVIGSNMYNLLAVMGTAGALSPSRPDINVLQRDFPVMIGMTVVLFAMAYSLNDEKGGRIARLEGGALLIAFFGYQAYVIMGSFA